MKGKKLKLHTIWLGEEKWESIRRLAFGCFCEAKYGIWTYNCVDFNWRIYLETPMLQFRGNSQPSDRQAVVISGMEAAVLLVAQKSGEEKKRERRSEQGVCVWQWEYFSACIPGSLGNKLRKLTRVQQQARCELSGSGSPSPPRPRHRGDRAAARAGGGAGGRGGRRCRLQIFIRQLFMAGLCIIKDDAKLHLRTKLRTLINRTNTIKQIEERKIYFFENFYLGVPCFWRWIVAGCWSKRVEVGVKNVSRVNAGVRT